MTIALSKIYVSPAKLNLFFCVLGKYKTGYHEVYSLMTALDFCDRISFKPASKDHFYSNQKSLAFNRLNLVWHAVSLFRKKTGFTTPVSISLQKNIPIGAGLAGGSSNAATTLFALNDLFKAGLCLQELREMGALLGSDVPFFFSSGQAIVSGQGQFVKDCTFVQNIPITLLLSPDIFVSTVKVFSGVKKYSLKSQVKDSLADFMNKGFCYHNDLLEPTTLLYPVLQKRWTLLQKLGLKVGMSGSGSTFFSQGQLGSLDLGAFEIVTTRPIKRDALSWY